MRRRGWVFMWDNLAVDSRGRESPLLVGLDPSLANRKQLASELGYTGDTQDSAKMNIWLHQQVMEKLAADGGKVPDSLRH